MRIGCEGGCGEFTTRPDEWAELGIVVKRRYCTSCRAEVEKYLAARDDLHERLGQQWSQGMEVLRMRFAHHLPKASLPDVP